MAFSSFSSSSKVEGRFSKKVVGSVKCCTTASKTVSESLCGEESIDDQIDRVNRSLQARKPGHMIRMERATFQHYAIYIGKDKVVDFVADHGGDVSQRNLFETVGSSRCAIDNYLDSERRPFTEQEIVQRALQAIVKHPTYDVAECNCEHFATWCRYGCGYCRQPCEVAAVLEFVSASTVTS